MTAIVRRVTDTFATSLFVSMFALVVVAIFSRYVLNQTLIWAEQFVLWLFAWSSFVGAAIAVREGRHFAFDLLVTSVPARLRRPLGAIIWLSQMVCGVALLVLGAQLIARTGSSVSPATGLPTVIGLLSVPVGGAIIFVESVTSSFESFSSRRGPVEAGELG